ncbi:hypothetical protein F892_01412 [Acinetobacter vivianii]|uniref:DUF4760 domain-containing protein n=1 Tax=Acinetobacter vivianii TaxID=1776742 RepID=N9PWY6_9GAMM|nr:hypothetical protein [Acinetobacter vivianii]ENX22171.1 hypothetical protein F892_01412 [Acinetobacter vivianii]GGI58541.1 hypothetical protein GCM10011446_00360 [Acinetobacter vivianii]
MEEIFKNSWLGLSGISIFTFLVGIIVGHKLNIHRDKRSRLFELSKDLKKYFLDQVDEPTISDYENIHKSMNVYIHYMSSINYFYKKKSLKLRYLSDNFFEYIKKAELAPSEKSVGYFYVNLSLPKDPEPIREKSKKILELLND